MIVRGRPSSALVRVSHDQRRGIAKVWVPTCPRDQPPLPDSDWQEGYKIWRDAVDSGKGGVFDKPVSECVGFVEEAMRRKPETTGK